MSTADRPGLRTGVDMVDEVGQVAGWLGADFPAAQGLKCSPRSQPHWNARRDGGWPT